MRYSAFGLVLDVEPAIPTLTRAEETTASTDIVCRLRQRVEPRDTAAHAAWYESDWLDEATGKPGLTIGRHEAGFVIRYADGAEFDVSNSGAEIVASYPPSCEFADVVCYLMGPVIGFVLRLRGTVSLHASAIQLGNVAVVLVGDAGAGKSTTAAQFARMGYKVLTEDIAALECRVEDVFVQPGCAEVALRPDAVSMLYGSIDALPRFSDSWDKRRLDLEALGVFSPDAARLGAVYLLTNRSAPHAPSIESVTCRQAMLELLANVYGNRLFHEELRAMEFSLAHRLATSIPIKVATTGGEGRFVERFCNAILEDVRPS